MINNFQIEEFLPKRISELRKQLNISAREMSLQLGQNANYINKVENGKILPSLIALTYICQFFNISLKKFFDTESTYPIRIQKLSSVIEHLNEEDFMFILNLANRLSRF